MARDRLARLLHERRHDSVAVVHALRAARMQRAARRRIQRIGKREPEPDVGHAEPRLGRQHRGEQRLRVRVPIVGSYSTRPR